MNYEQFKDYVKENMQYVIGEEVEISPIVRNNSFVRDGLCVQAGKEAAGTAIPTIYLDGYFQAYEAGTPAPQIIRDMTAFYEGKKRKLKIDLNCLVRFAQMRPRLLYRVISREKNGELLAHVPHKSFLDLEMVYYVLFMGDETGDATMLVENEHLEMWKASAEEVHRAAVENTPKLLPGCMRPMDTAMEELMSEDLQRGFLRQARQNGIGMGDEGAEEIRQMTQEMLDTIKSCQRQMPLYVLSNSRGLYGAACLLYEDLMKTCAETIGGDFYILPSSIHELLVMPVRSMYTSAELSEMVREINSTQVAPEEVLADHVYIYHRKMGKITM